MGKKHQVSMHGLNIVINNNVRAQPPQRRRASDNQPRQKGTSTGALLPNVSTLSTERQKLDNELIQRLTEEKKLQLEDTRATGDSIRNAYNRYLNYYHPQFRTEGAYGRAEGAYGRTEGGYGVGGDYNGNRNFMRPMGDSKFQAVEDYENDSISLPSPRVMELPDEAGTFGEAPEPVFSEDEEPIAEPKAAEFETEPKAVALENPFGAGGGPPPQLTSFSQLFPMFRNIPNKQSITSSFEDMAKADLEEKQPMEQPRVAPVRKTRQNKGDLVEKILKMKHSQPYVEELFANEAELRLKTIPQLKEIISRYNSAKKVRIGIDKYVTPEK